MSVHSPSPKGKPLFSAEGPLTLKNLNKMMVNTCLGSGKKRIPDNGQQCGCFFYKPDISCNMKLCSPQQKGKYFKKRLRANMREIIWWLQINNFFAEFSPLLRAIYTRTSFLYFTKLCSLKIMLKEQL